MDDPSKKAYALNNTNQLFQALLVAATFWFTGIYQRVARQWARNIDPHLHTTTLAHSAHSVCGSWLLHVKPTTQARPTTTLHLSSRKRACALFIGQFTRLVNVYTTPACDDNDGLCGKEEASTKIRTNCPFSWVVVILAHLGQFRMIGRNATRDDT